MTRQITVRLKCQDIFYNKGVKITLHTLKHSNISRSKNLFQSKNQLYLNSGLLENTETLICIKYTGTLIQTKHTNKFKPQLSNSIKLTN